MLKFQLPSVILSSLQPRKAARTPRALEKKALTRDEATFEAILGGEPDAIAVALKANPHFDPNKCYRGYGPFSPLEYAELEADFATVNLLQHLKPHSIPQPTPENIERAILIGNTTRVADWLASDQDLAQRLVKITADKDGPIEVTPLAMVAMAAKPNPKMAALLLACGANPDQADHNGRTAHDWAHDFDNTLAWGQMLANAQGLANEGKLTKGIPNPYDPLQTEQLKTLIDGESKDFTKENADKAAALVLAGADPKAVSSEKNTLAVLCAANGFIDALKVALDYGTDPNEFYGARRYDQAKLPLHAAAENNQLGSCQLLLDYGAKPNIKMRGDNQRTARGLAKEKFGKGSRVERLLGEANDCIASGKGAVRPRVMAAHYTFDIHGLRDISIGDTGKAHFIAPDYAAEIELAKGPQTVLQPV